MDIIKVCKDILIKYEKIIFAYIFGSYISGKFNEDSDIDIAIYTKEKIHPEEYLEVKLKLTERCRREVDLIILNDAKPLFRYEVNRNNKLLFTRDKNFETNYKVKTLFEYNDVKRYLDLSYDATIDLLRKEVEQDG
ncbi:nucleotidyltransferase domain-containing protein [Tissierella sp. Yu-01]|uniref:type VII toxin-antitoxin system MntA family adenylyltransferase antitoxin n=1 Tax=Tissierella sp. Yu-01 TaxID=3035694 RepID=UPI00240E3B0C|nr:nucleotidyltransferase domain-containing protein [Tissierella sp. Yu-01]WFA08591.1 nucleotidyltransferase domain-containing protein [Tissierella sp. Yu-01]